MALEELSFESVNGQTDVCTDGLTDNLQKVITIAHPEHSSGELTTEEEYLTLLDQETKPYSLEAKESSE